ncbi:MAG: HK97 gp10 family phage protein [bacterium]|nr:HK97 gp10 family phage protein [bacterium]
MSKRSHFDGRAARALARTVGLRALADGGEFVLTESQTEIPHASGTMQRTGTVVVAEREGAVYVSYSTPYAIRQHEDLTLRHPDPRNPLSTPGRKAKFLEDPFNRLKDRILKLARLRVQKALRDAK